MKRELKGPESLLGSSQLRPGNRDLPDEEGTERRRLLSRRLLPRR